MKPQASPRLDVRQREMLEAMGIQLWWPPEAKTRPVSAPEAPVEVSARPVAREVPPPAPAIQPAVAPPQAPRAPAPARAVPVLPGAEMLLADVPRLLYGEAGPGGWLIVADMAPDMLGGYGEPLGGDEGVLLANMLRALRLTAGRVPVYLVRVHRGVAPAPPDAGGQEHVQPFEAMVMPSCGPLVPRIVLAMGPCAAQAVLGRNEPLGKLRGQAQAVQGPLAGAHALATYHPVYLLRNGACKAKAWSDLCLAAALFERQARGD